MSDTNLALNLPAELAERIGDIAKRERRTLADQVLVFLEQITTFTETFKRHAAAMPAEVSLAELVPLMPPGLRSRSSIQRLLNSGAISGRKVRGTWSFKPAKVLADLDHFERMSVVEAVENRATKRRERRTRTKSQA